MTRRGRLIGLGVGPGDPELMTVKGVKALEDMHLRIVLPEEDGLPDWLPVGLPVVFERDKSATRALQNSASPQAYVLDTDRLVLAKRIVRSIDDLWDLQSTAHHMGGDALAIHISDRL